MLKGTGQIVDSEKKKVGRPKKNINGAKWNSPQNSWIKTLATQNLNKNQTAAIIKMFQACEEDRLKKMGFIPKIEEKDEPF
jgi:hypothetical protein